MDRQRRGEQAERDTTITALGILNILNSLLFSLLDLFPLRMRFYIIASHSLPIPIVLTLLLFAVQRDEGDPRDRCKAGHRTGTGTGKS